MDDDQCDFDTLSSMLDSAHDFDQDEVNDNELDHLASLIEQDQNGNAQISGKENQPVNKAVVTNNTSTVAAKATNDANSALLEELRSMQEKIRLLEAQISNQKSDDSSSLSPSFGPDLQIAPSHSGLKGKTFPTDVPKPSQKGATSDKVLSLSISSLATTSNQVQSKGMKEVNMDIFFGDQSDDLSKSSQQTLKPEHGRRNEERRDSDSDWEGLDGNEKSELSKAGQELRSLLKSGSGKRTAHVPSENRAPVSSKSLRKEKVSTTYVASLIGVPDHSTSVKPSASSTKKPEVDENVHKDCYSGIRVINPKISSTQLRSMMENRRMIRLSVLPTKIRGNDIDGDWVTIGVVIHKSEQRKSAKGTNFSFWKLSDLSDCDKTITLFLFGNVNKELWKTTVGSVVGILNASIMQNAEKNSKFSNDLSITVDNPQKVLIMGQSKDMGTCRGQTKNGNACNNVINTQNGEYCTYHIQAAYRKMSAKRSEIQSGHSGFEPKSFRQVLAKSGSVIYGGNEYFSTASSVAKKKDKVSIKSLQKHHLSSVTGSNKAILNTLALHDILPKDKSLLESSPQLPSDDKNKVFHDLLTVPSAGAMNFVKHLRITDKTEAGSKAKCEMKSVTATELLKQYKQETKALMERRKKPNPTDSALSLEPNVSRGQRGGSGGACPQLGRGLKEGDSVFLDDLPTKRKNSDVQAQKNLQAAVAVIKAKGGIVRQDPNAVRKERSSETREVIKRRILESTEGGCGGSSAEQPDSKKSKLLGGLDLNSPEIQKLLKAKSAHAALLTEAEQEKQELYFDVLEKTERMEEKMLATMEVKCTAVTCLQCKYTAFSAAQSCRDESHSLKRHPATKRFFRCKDCNKRCVTLDKLPTMSCKQCGGNNYERTSMMPAKSGPKLPTEQLLVRGEERKFINGFN